MISSLTPQPSFLIFKNLRQRGSFPRSCCLSLRERTTGRDESFAATASITRPAADRGQRPEVNQPEGGKHSASIERLAEVLRHLYQTD